MPYLNVTEINSAIVGLANGYPALCDIITLPHKTASEKHHTTSVLRIGLSRASGGKTGVLIMACAHACEWGGAEISINFAIALLEGYTNQSDVTFGARTFSIDEVNQIMTELTVFVLPLINPDGREYSQTVDYKWRKNRNGTGVDLNRNYDFLWFDNSFKSFVSSVPNDDNFKGFGPASENETLNVVSLVTNNRNIRWIMDIHSGSGNGENILWGWSDAPNQTEDPTMNFKNPQWHNLRGDFESGYREYIPHNDRNTVRRIGDSVRDAIKSVRGKVYITGDGTSFYGMGVPGLATDYFYSRNFVSSGLFGLPNPKVYGFGIEFSDKSPEHDWEEMKKIILDVDAGLFQFCLQALSTPPLMNLSALIYLIEYIKNMGEEVDGPMNGIRPGGVPIPIGQFPPYLDPNKEEIRKLLEIDEQALQIKDPEVSAAIRKTVLKKVSKLIEELSSNESVEIVK